MCLCVVCICVYVRAVWMCVVVYVNFKLAGFKQSELTEVCGMDWAQISVAQTDVHTQLWNHQCYQETHTEHTHRGRKKEVDIREWQKTPQTQERWSKREHRRETPMGKTDRKEIQNLLFTLCWNPRTQSFCLFLYDKTTSSFATHDIPDWKVWSWGCRLQYGCWQQLNSFYVCLSHCLNIRLLRTPLAV